MSGNSTRKLDHLRICLEEDVHAPVLTAGLERYHFRHQALPELALSDVRLDTTFLGKPLRAPLLISAMTGGAPDTAAINRNLARAAQALGLAMGVGSQRAAIEDPTQAHTYQVREVAPDILLFANLGAVQLNYGYGLEECQQAVDMISADALVLHLNPMQECLQPGGNTNFAGLADKIAQICRGLSVPVVVKEVGWGISDWVARLLVEAGVAAIDVAGAGGTSWSEVEKHRGQGQRSRTLAEHFAHWGIPTAEAIQLVRATAPDIPIIASGGIRTGPDLAVALALGANIAGMALPLLEPATRSPEAVVEVLNVVIEGLRIAMFCAGAADIPALKATPVEVR
ncbi:MAG: type 2 isopentenyl-diphosphate Delta-isomerase [Chloroflexi bacterium]|nr:type 2 isopentenyl-diphosphate Delta-isomerase [Chloroflexota bacterium]